VPDPIDSKAAPNSASPLVLVPLTAQDAARRRRRIQLLSLAALLALAAGAGWIYKRAQNPREAQASFDAGQRLFADARYGQAILYFDRAILLVPDHAEAYLQRGKAYVAQYDGEHAVLDFTKAIELRPLDPRPLLERGRAYFLDKKFEPAIDDATTALAIDRNLAAAYNLRGMAQRSLGKPQQALADFQHAVALSPDADNYYQRGATYQLLGQHRLAIADFTETIGFVPDLAQGYFARAESERALGDDDAAKRDHLQGRILDGR